MSHFGQQVDYGFFGNVDVAIIEATAITAEGNIILGPGVGNAPIFVKHAKKIIIEVNTSIPLNLEGMHDIYIPAIPPNRTEIPIYHAGDRIGKPYVECGIDRIDCIVESDILDHVRDLTAPDAASIKIAENLVEFLEYEQKMDVCQGENAALAVRCRQYCQCGSFRTGQIQIWKIWKCIPRFYRILYSV